MVIDLWRALEKENVLVGVALYDFGNLGNIHGNSWKFPGFWNPRGSSRVDGKGNSGNSGSICVNGWMS